MECGIRLLKLVHLDDLTPDNVHGFLLVAYHLGCTERLAVSCALLRSCT